MPVYLKEANEYTELEKFKSVLIVPCRFCPAASMAVRKEEPYFEIFRRLMKTAAYESLIETIRGNLESKGVKTDVFRSHLLHQFVVCMWTSRRRRKLLEHAGKYEALLVMGCETAVQTIQDSVKSTNCKVFQGMSSEGIMSVLPQFSFPFNISLQLNNITPLIPQKEDSELWLRL